MKNNHIRSLILEPSYFNLVFIVRVYFRFYRLRTWAISIISMFLIEIDRFTWLGVFPKFWRLLPCRDGIMYTFQMLLISHIYCELLLKSLVVLQFLITASLEQRSLQRLVLFALRERRYFLKCGHYITPLTMLFQAISTFHWMKNWIQKHYIWINLAIQFHSWWILTAFVKVIVKAYAHGFILKLEVSGKISRRSYKILPPLHSWALRYIVIKASNKPIQIFNGQTIKSI